MGYPVRVLQRMIDSKEFAEWMAYYQIEPFGEERADLREAMVPFMLANAFGEKGKKPKLEDFLISNLINDEPKLRQSLEEMQVKLKGIAKRYEEAQKRGNNR